MTWLSALRASPYLAILALLAVVAYQSDKIHDWHQQADHCAEARRSDQATYRAAQAEAQAQNRAEVARIEKQQQDINNEVTRDLNARLERLRSELRQRASADQGHSHGTGAPQGPGGPAAPGEAGVCLTSEQFLHAAENEERHDQLITAVTRLMALLNSK